MKIRLFAVGLVTILGQVLLLRELAVAFFGSELIYILAFSFLMLGTALGASAAGMFQKPTVSQTRWLFIATAAMMPSLVALSRAIRIIFRGTPGAYLPFLHQLAAMGLILLPFGLAAGMLFQRAAALYTGGSGSLAAAYAIESAGSVFGGIASTALIAAGVQNFSASLLCALACAISALLPWSEKRGRAQAATAALLLLVLLSLLVIPYKLDHFLTSLNHPNLVSSRDTPYGRLTAESDRGMVSLFSNGALAFESQGTSAEEFVHLSALQVKDFRSALILGGGAEGLALELLKHSPERIDYIELDGEYIDMAARYLPAELAGSLKDSRVRTVIADPRAYLQSSARYDLILVGLPEPQSSQTNRFYTSEFFKECAAHLNRGGVLGLRLQSSENLWTPVQKKRIASISRAIGSAFADRLILPGTTNIIACSQSRLEMDPEVLSWRLQSRGIEARLVSPQYLRYILTNDRLAEIGRTIAETGAPSNRDGRPICYQLTMQLWLSKFFPAAAATGGALGDGKYWPVATAASALVALFFLRSVKHLRPLLLVGLAGFAGMVIESAVMLAYQARYGALYQNLGLLLTMFMSGLAAGSCGYKALLGSPRFKAVDPRATGGFILAIFIGLTGLCIALFGFGVMPGLPVSSLLLLACGLCVGGIFAHASLHPAFAQVPPVSSLYAWDLVGGCVGSLAGSLLLIPSAGLAGACLAAAIALAASLMLI